MALFSYFTTLQAADYLGLSRQALELWRHRGEGPPYCKIGRSVRYRRAALDEFMLSLEHHPEVELRR